MGGLVINTANGAREEVQPPVEAVETQQNGTATMKKKKRRAKKGKKINGAERVNKDGHEQGHDDEGEGSEGGDGGAVNGGDISGHAVTDVLAKPIDQPMTSPEDWQDGPEDIPVSMAQLINGPKESLDKDHDRQTIADYVASKEHMHGYRCLKESHRELLINYIYNIKYPNSDPNWPATVRQVFWRAIIRVSYFWTNPETGKTGVKPKPVHRPDGIYENDMHVWLMCAAERSDRVGRDLPTAEHVEKVEREVRMFLKKAEDNHWWELQCLAFLLMFDEEYRHNLSLEHLKERIRKAFRSAKFDWKGCDMFKPGHNGVGVHGMTSLNTAMSVWEDAQKFA